MGGRSADHDTCPEGSLWRRSALLERRATVTWATLKGLRTLLELEASEETCGPTKLATDDTWTPYAEEGKYGQIYHRLVWEVWRQASGLDEPLNGDCPAQCSRAAKTNGRRSWRLQFQFQGSELSVVSCRLLHLRALLLCRLGRKISSEAAKWRDQRCKRRAQ